MIQSTKKKGMSRKEIDEMLRGAHPDFQDQFRRMMENVEDDKLKGQNSSVSFEDLQNFRKDNIKQCPLHLQYLNSVKTIQPRRLALPSRTFYTFRPNPQALISTTSKMQDEKSN